MKIRLSQLRRIIKEEVEKAVSETTDFESMTPEKHALLSPEEKEAYYAWYKDQHGGPAARGSMYNPDVPSKEVQTSVGPAPFMPNDPRGIKSTIRGKLGTK